MIPAATRAAADAWWSRDFACAPAELRPHAPRVQAHVGELAGNPGIWILRVGDRAPLVSLPPAAAALADRLWTRALLEDPVALAAAVAPLRPTNIIGPAFIGYLDEGADPAALAAGARPLVASDERDRAAVVALRASVDGEAWDHGGSDIDHVPTFGAFDPHGLAALAGYEVWGERIAHIAIVSARPGRGHATAAVARATLAALGAGLVPQYRTLAANQASMRVAAKLGYVEYGASVYVRLAD